MADEVTTPKDASVEIRYDGSVDPPVILVTPTSADIEGQGKVTWIVKNLPAGASVRIEFADADRCPFGSYSGCDGEISTDPARPGTNRRWSYTVRLDGTARGTAPSADGAIVINRNP